MLFKIKMRYLPALSKDQSDNIKAGQKDSSPTPLPLSLLFTSLKLETNLSSEEVEEVVSSDFVFFALLDMGLRHFFNSAGFGRVSVVLPSEV